MFCKKCGAEMIEGALFCQKCGTKAVTSEVVQQISNISEKPVSQPFYEPEKEKVKKPTKLIFGIAALVIVVIVSVVLFGKINKVDFVESVKQVAPYENSGMSATYGTVLDKYISECNWQERPLSRKSAYIDVSGKMIEKDGSESYVVITFKVEPYEGKPSGMFTVSPDALVLDRVNYNAAAASGFISKLFDAYDKGFDTYAEYLDPDETQPADEYIQTEQADVSDTPVYDVDASGDNYYDTSIISSRSIEEIEDYITSYVRPLYNEVNSNLSNYSTSSSNGVTYWHDGKGYIKKRFSPEVNNYGFTREYYFDTDSGRIAFAFVYSGSTEYRLYFRTNQLVRYIPPTGQTINNPDSADALEMGTYVLWEAYQ